MGDSTRQIKLEGPGSDGFGDDEMTRCFGAQSMISTQLCPSVLSGADEDHISKLERVLLAGPVGTLDVPVLMLQKDG